MDFFRLNSIIYSWKNPSSKSHLP